MEAQKVSETKTVQAELINPQGQSVQPDSLEGQQLMRDLAQYLEAQTNFVATHWSVTPDEKMKIEWRDDFLEQRGYTIRLPQTVKDGGLSTLSTPGDSKLSGLIARFRSRITRRVE